MTINVVSYATGRFIRSQKILEQECYKFGADKVFSYSINDIDEEFKKNNYNILSQNRGGGYWCWKPYVINKAFQALNENDVLIYIDSGAYPINDLSLLPSSDSINCFQLYGMINKHWTKYDCFYLMNCLENFYLNSYQFLASFQVYKVNKFSNSFIAQYLNFCCNFEIITDAKCVYGNNFDCFKDHRHDQSIFSNLCLKYNIYPHRDPSQWGNAYIDKYSDSYPQIFNLHRGSI